LDGICGALRLNCKSSVTEINYFHEIRISSQSGYLR
jgi:hypothetical protein